MKNVLPLTGQSESEGRHQLQLTSYQSPERLEQVLSRPPDDERTNIQKLVQPDAMQVFIRLHQISTHCLQCKSHVNTIHSLNRDGFLSHTGCFGKLWHKMGERNINSSGESSSGTLHWGRREHYCLKASLHKRTAGLSVCLPACLSEAGELEVNKAESKIFIKDEFSFWE